LFKQKLISGVTVVTYSTEAKYHGSDIDMPLIKQGDCGEAVRFVQQILICYGYLTSKSFDAEFGPVTEKAVKAFQTENKLLVDGIVGKQTWRALGAACAIKKSDPKPEYSYEPLPPKPPTPPIPPAPPKYEEKPEYPTQPEYPEKVSY
jgi:peptidoglycan hydrolase-like protein with peptidoglycan-binding domain